jgi:hypothetical protein
MVEEYRRGRGVFVSQAKPVEAGWKECGGADKWSCGICSDGCASHVALFEVSPNPRK